MWATRLSLAKTRQITLLTFLTGSVFVVWLSSTEALAQITPFQNGTVLASSSKSIIPFDQIITTTSLFDHKFFTDTVEIPYTTEYVNDNNLEFGKLTTLQEGKTGSRILKTKITYYQQKEYAKEEIVEEISAPIAKIVSRGTKKIIQTLDTSFGKLSYFSKLSVYATSYDKNCRGCNETTATGARVGFGIIAVDPKVIPMGTKLYVPGYGVGVAADTGGAIKGNIIDLAFEDVRFGWWSARNTDVYLLSE
jgi:3D (Asp-Asp-Asp) domain-containing protein